MELNSSRARFFLKWTRPMMRFPTKMNEKYLKARTVMSTHKVKVWV